MKQLTKRFGKKQFDALKKKIGINAKKKESAKTENVLEFRGKIKLKENALSFEQKIGFNSTLDARIKALRYACEISNADNFKWDTTAVLQRLVKEGRNDIILAVARIGLSELFDKVMKI